MPSSRGRLRYFQPTIFFLISNTRSTKLRQPLRHRTTLILYKCPHLITVESTHCEHAHEARRTTTIPRRAFGQRLSGLPIDLRILERYGIENYFPQSVFEKIIGIDLSSYFPIPDDVPAVEQLSKSGASWKYKLRKFVALKLGFPQPSPKEPFYAKSRNAEAARYLALQDLQGTDLFNIVHDICETAKRMRDE